MRSMTGAANISDFFIRLGPQTETSTDATRTTTSPASTGIVALTIQLEGSIKQTIRKN